MSSRLRIIFALCGAVLVAGGAWMLWSSANFDHREDSGAAAVAQFVAAQNVLSFTEAGRVENVKHFAFEVAQKPGVKEFQNLSQAVAATSFGEVGPGVTIVDRTGKRVWSSGDEKADGVIALPELKSVLEGEIAHLLLVKPDDAAAKALAPPLIDVPALVTIAALRDGKETFGALIVSEPVTPEFFQNLGQLAGVRGALVGSSATYGNAPAETYSVKAGAPQLVQTPSGLVWATRVPFRVTPGFDLGEVLLVADGRRAQPWSAFQLWPIVAGLFLLLLASIKRA